MRVELSHHDFPLLMQQIPRDSPQREKLGQIDRAAERAAELAGSSPEYFDYANFSFTTPAQTAFDTLEERNAIVLPLLAAVMNVDPDFASNNLTSQPGQAEISDLLSSPDQQFLEDRAYDSLITRMLSNNVDGTDRTAQVVKAVCAAAVGGAVMLVQ